jgi:uncharacterized protein (TIGR03067 family)
MKPGLVVLISLLTLLFASSCKNNLHMSEIKSLRGRWHLIKEIHQGKETPAEEIKNGYIIFDADNNWRVEVDDKTVGGGTFIFDPDKNPKTIDYSFSIGEEKGQNFHAIYELNGDSFRHCGVMDGERPKDFSAGAGSKNYLVTFEREKIAK